MPNKYKLCARLLILIPASFLLIGRPGFAQSGTTQPKKNKVYTVPTDSDQSIVLDFAKAVDGTDGTVKGMSEKAAHQNGAPPPEPPPDDYITEPAAIGM